MDLARVLAAVPESKDVATWQAALEPWIRENEETMLARAQEKAEETDMNRKMFLSENGAEEMVKFFGVYDDVAAAGSSSKGQ